MLIECLIEREGPTIIDVGKMRYVFGPQPALTGGDSMSSVCDINSKEHSDHLLGLTQLYRKYEPKSRTQLTVMALKQIHDPDALSNAVMTCMDVAALREVQDHEITALNSRDWLVDMITERIDQIENPEARNERLKQPSSRKTKDIFEG